jgi:D-galactarolactone cycloisomerase
MKITSVKTFYLKHQLPNAFGCSTFLYKERDVLLVKIMTDEGIFGWGETCWMGSVRGLINDQLGPSLIGQNPLEHRKIWRQLWGPAFGNGLAVAALDMALLDIRGKALKMSISDMYGGRLRDRVMVYASGMNYKDDVDPAKQYPEDAAALRERGFRAMKMRIGRYDLRRDLAAAAAVRDVVGPDVKLMADGNAAYTFGPSVTVGKELYRLDYYWFEEPMPHEPSYPRYEELRDKLDIPLSGGEILASRGEAKDLLNRGCFDIIQPDPSLCGGIGECLAVAEMARLWGVQCQPHCWAGAISTAATLQVLSLLPDSTWGYTPEQPMLEMDLIENPFRDKITKEPPKVARDGYIDVPKGPGLGIEVDEDALKQYLQK